MPGGDGTGPEGKGSRTGRGLGNCLPKTQLTTTTSEVQPCGRGRGLSPCGRGYEGSRRRVFGRRRGRW